jgi:hypothetical protein
LDQYYPRSKNPDYQKDYREQYHLSPKSGWLNENAIYTKYFTGPLIITKLNTNDTEGKNF